MKLIFETISRYVVSTETNMSSSQMTSLLKWDCKGCNETLKSLNWSKKNQSCSCLKRRRKDKVRYTSWCYQWWAPVMSEALCPVMGTSGQGDNPVRPPGDHVRCHMPDHSLITRRGQWIRVSKQHGITRLMSRVSLTTCHINWADNKLQIFVDYVQFWEEKWAPGWCVPQWGLA